MSRTASCVDDRAPQVARPLGDKPLIRFVVVSHRSEQRRVFLRSTGVRIPNHIARHGTESRRSSASVSWEMATPATPMCWGMSHRPEVILVHGIWHQPAHFDRLTAALRSHGIGVHVPRLHRCSLTNDAAAVQSVVDALPVAPAALGHSYGGRVSQASIACLPAILHFSVSCRGLGQ